MRLLDCGCGPGGITVGLAQRVSPGEVAGIDIGGAQWNAPVSERAQPMCP
jgi:ubiquinone/menaquinone biosynthesis C-methylase UbiE